MGREIEAKPVEMTATAFGNPIKLSALEAHKEVWKRYNETRGYPPLAECDEAPMDAHLARMR